MINSYDSDLHVGSASLSMNKHLKPYINDSNSLFINCQPFHWYPCVMCMLPCPILLSILVCPNSLRTYILRTIITPYNCCRDCTVECRDITMIRHIVIHQTEHGQLCYTCNTCVVILGVLHV